MRRANAARTMRRVTAASVNATVAANARSELIKAVKTGNINTLTRLLNSNTPPNINTRNSNTSLLIWSLVKNKINVARLLINRGANVNSNGYHKQRAVMWAAQGKPDILALLIQKGANVNAKDGNEKTALHWACVNVINVDTRLTCVKLLLKAGADIDAQDIHGETPLWVACESYALPIIEYLIRAGANINIPNRIGLSPFDIVLNTNHDIEARNRALIILIKHGALKSNSVKWNRLQNILNRNTALRNNPNIQQQLRNSRLRQTIMSGVSAPRRSIGNFLSARQTGRR
jgi:ankyrin repeat protein